MTESEYNSAGKEIWWSTHINGKIRPELADLPTDQWAQAIAEHAPDLTPAQADQLRMLLGYG